MEFKEKLKFVRQKLMMSQQDFAKELGVAYTSINRWESGRGRPHYRCQRQFKELCDKHGIKDSDYEEV